MNVARHLLCPLLLVGALARCAVAADPIETATLERADRHIAPLTHPLGDRLPILVWQWRGAPTGLKDGRISETQQFFMDRGLSLLCNPVSTQENAAKYAPLLQYRQSRGFPVCILPQGWLQVFFTSDRRGRAKAPHAPPAESSEKYACPAALMDARRLEKAATKTRRALTTLKRAGVDVNLLVVDFESGAYLRNKYDKLEAVERQAAMARQCPKCVERFGREALSTPEGYAEIVDRARAFGIRSMLSDPARAIYPDVHIGNYYAWPINRLPRPDGRAPAYGYEHSGMNVAMPRVYMNAGWAGGGRDQAKTNWSAFRSCLAGFSPAASVMQPGEILIPWMHIWIGGRHLDLVMQGRKLPEPRVMHEVACHMMLRGAETFAFWTYEMESLPDDYPYPEYAAMGQFVYDVKGVQAGFNEMLRFHDFLRRAEPVTFDVPGRFRALGPETATWSAMRTDQKALVRTVSFNGGRPVTKSVTIYDRPVQLTFDATGRNHWVYPDGRVETIGPRDE